MSRLAVPQNMLEKTDLLLLSRHTILKTQLLVDQSNTGRENDPAGEPMCKSNGFFWDEKFESAMNKSKYPESKLLYLNQA